MGMYVAASWAAAISSTLPTLDAPDLALLRYCCAGVSQIRAESSSSTSHPTSSGLGCIRPTWARLFCSMRTSACQPRLPRADIAEDPRARMSRITRGRRPGYLTRSYDNCRGFSSLICVQFSLLPTYASSHFHFQHYGPSFYIVLSVPNSLAQTPRSPNIKRKTKLRPLHGLKYSVYCAWYKVCVDTIV